MTPASPTRWQATPSPAVYRGAVYHIRVENPHAVQKGVQSVTVNGAPIAGTLLPLAKAGESVEVSVILG